MSNNIVLKYQCLDHFDEIVNELKDNQKMCNYLLDLRELIFYQMNEIKNQRSEIIAIKHKIAWKHYNEI